MKLEIYIDGAARGNPGPSGIGIVILDEAGQTLREIKEYIGTATNNIAEYSAAVKALKTASQIGAKDIIIYSDSELVTKQLTGEYRVRDERLRQLFVEIKQLEKDFDSVDIRAIPREANKRADKLANIAINLGDL